MDINAKNEMVLEVGQFKYNLTSKKWTLHWRNYVFEKDTFKEISRVSANLEKLSSMDIAKLDYIKPIRIFGTQGSNWYKIRCKTYYLDTNGTIHTEEVLGLVAKSKVKDRKDMTDRLLKASIIVDQELIEIIKSRDNVFYDLYGYDMLKKPYPTMKNNSRWNCIDIDNNLYRYDILEVMYKENSIFADKATIPYNEVGANETLIIYKETSRYRILVYRLYPIERKTITEVITSKKDLEAYIMAFPEMDVIELDDNVYQIDLNADCEIYPGLHLKEDDSIKLLSLV